MAHKHCVLDLAAEKLLIFVGKLLGNGDQRPKKTRRFDGSQVPILNCC